MAFNLEGIPLLERAVATQKVREKLKKRALDNVAKNLKTSLAEANGRFNPDSANYSPLKRKRAAPNWKVIGNEDPNETLEEYVEVMWKVGRNAAPLFPGGVSSVQVKGKDVITLLERMAKHELDSQEIKLIHTIAKDSLKPKTKKAKDANGNERPVSWSYNPDRDDFDRSWDD